MRIISLLILSAIILSACNTDDGLLPTQLDLPAATKTLIPTQSQQLTTPTLPQSAADADRQSENTQEVDTSTAESTPIPTDTPIECNLQDEWETYVVQRGDNLAAIANRTGSTIVELTEANCLENPNRLSVGQELYVPELPATATIITTPTATTAAPRATIQTSTPRPSTNPTRSATANPTQSTASTPTQSSVGVSIDKTFESEIGFGLNFPVDWYLIESTTSTVENVFITSFEYTPGDEIPQNGWTDDMVSITLTIFQETTTESLSDWSQSILNQLQDASNIAEVFTPVTLRTDGELEGRSIDYVTEDDTVVRNYYFIINNHKVQLNIGGNLDLAVPVVNSMHINF